MNPRLWRPFLMVMMLCALTDYQVFAQQGDDASIRQVVQNMQDGWNKKDGRLFASSFAEEHDYVVINGMFLPKLTRESNARQHQQLFDGVYKEVDLQLRVSQIRHLNPEIAVAHISGHSHPKGSPEEKRSEVIITAVVQKREGGWKIVAFHNSPVQQRAEKQADK